MGRFFSRPRAYFSRTAADRAEVVVHAVESDALAGLRIVFLSDTHADRRFSDAAMDALFARVGALKPDLLLFGGDFAESAADLKRLLRALDAVRPPLGIFGCMGNNDRELGGFSALVEGRVRMLVNESVEIPLPGGRLRIGGVDDHKHGRLSARGLFPRGEDAFRVLLSHYPVAQDYGSGARADLQLSGHTHGGQFNFLGVTPYALLFERSAHRWISGECKIDGVRTIVSNGLGMSRIPLRVGVPPQLHLVQFDKTKKMGWSPVDTAPRR